MVVSRAISKPVRVEFVGILPTLFAHCQHCMEAIHGTGMEPYSEQFEEYPEELKKEYFQLSEIAQKLNDEFGIALAFDAVDIASPPGLWKSIRHGILKTPCVLIDGRKAFEKLPSYDELRAKLLELLPPTSEGDDHRPQRYSEFPRSNMKLST